MNAAHILTLYVPNVDTGYTIMFCAVQPLISIVWRDRELDVLQVCVG